MLFKISYDTSDKTVTYVTRYVVVHHNASSTSIERINNADRAWLLQMGSAIGSVDKVIGPERKAFWLCYNRELRAMGACR